MTGPTKEDRDRAMTRILRDARGVASSPWQSLSLDAADAALAAAAKLEEP